MLRNSTKLLFIILPMLLALSGIHAQGWERSFGNEKNESLSDVLPTSDGGFITVGHQEYLTSADIDVRLIKTDADGQMEWSKLIGEVTHSEYGKSIEATTDGGFIIGGTALLDDFLYGFLLKTDAQGNEEWLTLSSRDSIQGRKAIELADGGFALVGTEMAPPSAPQPDSPNNELMLMKVNSNGVEQWITNYGGEAYEEGYGLVETSDGFMLAGYTNSFGAGHYDIYIVKTDENGTEQWYETHGTIHAELCFGFAACDDGNFIVTGQSEKLTPESEDAFLLKIDPAGQELWWQTYEKSGLELANHVEQTTDGGYIITGNVRDFQSADHDVFLLKATADGLEHWTKEFGGINGDGGNSVREAPSDGFVIAGFTRSFGNGGADAYLLRTDFSGIANSCFIFGNVFSNLNNNCNALSFDKNIEGYIVEISSASGSTYFGTSDEDGNYLVPIPEGDYNVRIVNPSPYWDVCEDSVDVSVAGSFDTAIVDFALHTEIACPLMEVDLTTLGLRRCFPGTYTIEYENIGTVVANPAMVEVTFDEYLVIDSSSMPWVSQNGNTYTFNVGNVWPFEGGSFKVHFTVDCDSTVLGQTHCSEALITPDSLCVPPSPMWDESSIEVDAICMEDSIIFKIKNIGQGDMDEPLGFIIIEDHIVEFQGDFNLEKEQDTTIVIPSSGGTFRMEADQSEGHPGNSKPCVSVEGCGGAPFTTGFVIQYPLNDADLSVDTDCRENTGSYDPNDKQGFPMGYGIEHFIWSDTELEYLIRFQNTGTDTAFTVVIRDTLSHFLDPTSIQPGACSHNCRFELYGSGIVKFTFDDIMLPDSNVNEAASHGFVKFRINQREGNDIGTLIKNHAGIYFDFNEPIITNTTYHTIGNNFILIDPDTVNTTSEQSIEATVRVYPNPFDEKAMFELENVIGNEFRFSLFDATGQLQREEMFHQKNFQFNRRELAAGIYFFQIEVDAMRIASGKVILR